MAHVFCQSSADGTIFFCSETLQTIETTHRLSACPLAAWLQAPIILFGKVLQQLETLSAPVIKGIATLVMSVSCKWKQCHSELHMPFVDELSCRLQLLLAISLIHTSAAVHMPLQPHTAALNCDLCCHQKDNLHLELAPVCCAIRDLVVFSTMRN